VERVEQRRNGGNAMNPQLSYALARARMDEIVRAFARQRSEIEAELSRLEALHMEEWVARFAQALELDLIGPDDF
jgi:hypothetical protein